MLTKREKVELLLKIQAALEAAFQSGRTMGKEAMDYRQAPPSTADRQLRAYIREEL